ncbi:hypothetical protein F4820DRAFT_103383 [Hypoxylon rubiginosum]|uniref:Uncharacterized protein n=1 Tax=Hypoxylon rubiginosum TaxID=110542 RepID=A0ACB9ZAY0_9PEZI|nr:hypothetical protein F4820DRAFT_103383 [Hypoxylon rubiginosum]
MSFYIVLLELLQMYSASCQSFELPTDQVCIHCIQPNLQSLKESPLSELVELVPAVACSFIATSYIVQKESTQINFSIVDSNYISHNTIRFHQKRLARTGSWLLPGAGMLSILIYSPAAGSRSGSCRGHCVRPCSAVSLGMREPAGIQREIDVNVQAFIRQQTRRDLIPRRKSTLAKEAFDTIGRNHADKIKARSYLIIYIHRFAKTWLRHSSRTQVVDDIRSSHSHNALRPQVKSYASWLRCSRSSIKTNKKFTPMTIAIASLRR